MKRKKQLGFLRLSVWGVRFLWHTSKKDTVGYVLTDTVQVATEVFQLWVAALAVNEVSKIISTHSNGNWLLTLAGISLVLMAMDKVAWSLLGLFERRLYLQGSGDTYRLFNGQLAMLSVSQHNNPKIRKLIDRLEIEGYAWKPLNFSFEILYTQHALLRFLTSSVLIVQQLPLVVILLIVGTVPALLIQRKEGATGWGIWTDIGDTSRVFWGISSLLRLKNSVEEIIPQRSAEYLLNQADTAITSYTRKAIEVRSRFVRYDVLASIFEMLMAGLSYVWLILRTIAGQVTFNRFVFMSSLIWQTLSSVRLVTTSIARALALVPFMRDFVYFSELKNDLTQVEHPVKLDPNSALTIELQNVSFKYPRQKKYRLKDISVTIKPGEHIALVGLNGAGKTTLIRLLLRFYDPSEGQILVNGTDLREIDLDSYYQHIGTLFQEFNKYPLSFLSNVTLSEKTDRARYNQVLEISGAADTLKSISGEFTMLGPDFKDGSDLSGGQWQRVAIARSLYSSGDIFILDEPTSAIDALAEQQIFEKLYRELNGKVLITVSHRFNTVRKADSIIVLEDGKIAEQGTHTELMKHKGLYHQMFTAQAEGYAE